MVRVNFVSIFCQYECILLIHFLFSLIVESDEIIFLQYLDQFLMSNDPNSCAASKFLRRFQVDGVIEQQFLGIPVCIGNMHWVLLVADTKSKIFYIMDSLGKSEIGSEILDKIKKWIEKKTKFIADSEKKKGWTTCWPDGE